MRRLLPRLQQIEAFVEAAGAPSFRVAADRCGVSPAAFSRRIQALSHYVGATLFEKTAEGSRLTEAGRYYLQEIGPAFTELQRVTAACGDRSGRLVVLSLSSALAVGWFIPRLPELRRDHPEIDVDFKIERDARAIRKGECDLAICFSDVDLAGLNQQRLMNVSALPLAAPGLAEEFRARDGSLEDHPLLESRTWSHSWERWSNITRRTECLEQVVQMDTVQLMYESASQGLGIAMASIPTVLPYLHSGRLTPIGLPIAKWPGGYNIAVMPDRKRRRSVDTLWSWLTKAAQQPLPAI